MTICSAFVGYVITMYVIKTIVMIMRIMSLCIDVIGNGCFGFANVCCD